MPNPRQQISCSLLRWRSVWGARGSYHSLRKLEEVRAANSERIYNIRLTISAYLAIYTNIGKHMTQEDFALRKSPFWVLSTLLLTTLSFQFPHSRSHCWGGYSNPSCS